jgi:hypothetical protein
MRKLLFALAAGAALVAAVPASAQVYFGADPGGVGVQVGRLVPAWGRDTMAGAVIMVPNTGPMARLTSRAAV